LRLARRAIRAGRSRSSPSRVKSLSAAESRFDSRGTAMIPEVEARPPCSDVTYMGRDQAI
jgi:hypothetical protein